MQRTASMRVTGQKMNESITFKQKKLKQHYLSILLILMAVITISLASGIYHEIEHHKSAALEHAKNSFIKDLMFRKWIASHGGVYVTPTKRTPPNPYLAHIKDRDLVTTSGKKLTLMNPAYALRQLMDYEGMYGAKGHITSLKLLNPNNKPSDWEIKALKLFDQGQQTELHEFVAKEGQDYIYYMKALVVKKTCLKCHAHQGYKVGDIRGGVSVTIPMKKYNNDTSSAVYKLIAVYLVFYIIVIIGLFYTYSNAKKSLLEQHRLEQENHRKDEIMLAQSRHAAMGEMIAMIAHQWRQPITVIAMGANNMLADVELENVSDKSIKDQSYSILKQTEYLSTTIDDFRNFFRPDREKDEVRLEQVMYEAEKIIGKSLEHSNIKLTIRHSNGYIVKTYSRELLQVYINLLKNAKEALVDNVIENGWIDVLIADDNEHVITTICDNGGGIDTAIIDRIFDPYFTTKGETIGTGLGLYMSKTIVEKHLQGSLEVANKEKGVCFKIAIPIMEKTEV
ncbi:MAG: DUF3365 domain-containing protein [gamma proteobacterium symbiont of Taylorina sp.]|nr:DUF3365 domain-containing protein [gamma proteobacterium symbiont of Taylorina sp.]